VSAILSVQAPFTWQPAIELGNRQWVKKILPIGSIDYKGRQLRFDRSYLSGLVNAFRSRAYDQVPLQLADASNSHTNDPERTAGEITDLELRDDGLYALAHVTERGERVLAENPRLGVSARIVEQYARSDGKFFPAAVQHVLATLDPRVPGLGAWQPVDMSNGAEMVIDLSGSSFAGDAPPAYASGLDELLDGLSEAEGLELLEAVYDSGDELSDDELAAWVDSLDDDELAALEAEGYGGREQEDPMAEFEHAFSNSRATELARQQQDAEPAIRRATGTSPTEDRLAWALQRVAAGTFTGRAELSSSLTAIEMANSAGLCGPVDPGNGICLARYHKHWCSSGIGSASPVQLANSGAYDDALDRLAVDAASGSMSAWSDRDQESILIPAHTLELARSLNDAWGLHGDATWDAEPDILPGERHGDAYSRLARELGRDDLAAPQLGQEWPDVSALRAGLGL
jgi:hypothetical protein